MRSIQPKVAGALAVIVAATVLVAWLTLGPNLAQSTTLVTTPALWRGGDTQSVSWEGDSPALSAEFSPDKGLSWVSLGVSGASPMAVRIPKVDSNSATIRILLEDGTLRTSDAFVVDSTAPVSAVTGRAFMSLGRGTAPKGRVVVPFDALGSDVSGLVVRYTREGAEPVETEAIQVSEAIRDGFPAPSDGIWDIMLIARDRVGNVETKTQPDVRRFVVDTVAPVVSIKHSVEGHAIGGDRVPVTFEANDDNLDLNTLKFEYLAGEVIREPIDFSPLDRAGTREWVLPREDHKHVKIRMTVSDRAGNTSTAETGTFALFSGRPQAVIVNEEDGGQSRIDFEIALLNADSLAHIDEPTRVDLYVGGWDAATLRWVWDTENPHRDLELRTGGDGRKRITYAGPNISKAFLARLVVGDGNNRLTEPVPGANAAPESVFRAGSRVARVKLTGQSQGRASLMYGSGQPVEFQYSVPDDVIRDSRLAIEYSTDFGVTWLPVTMAPIPVNREKVVDSYLWTSPPAELEYAAIRAVTMITSGTIEYRVTDLMSGGLVIDGNAPKAEIIRVLDSMGRALTSGEYTSSPWFDIEWRASDTGGSGMAEAVLWDDAAFAAGVAPEGMVWNQNQFQPDSVLASEVARKLDFTNPVVRVTLGKPSTPVGRVGFVVEGIDRAGNRRFRTGRPDRETPRAFSLNIDYLAPKVVLTEQPAGGEFMPGAQVRIGWRATDDSPDPRIADSLGPHPVSIYVVDDGGGQSLIATGLEPSGSLLVTIPALSDTTISFLVSARDRAGNPSGIVTEATTRALRIQNAAVPEVRLRPELVDEAGALAFQWDQTRGRTEELMELRLWASLNGGTTWEPAGTFEPGQRVTYALPGYDADFVFSLTARSTSELSEPDPRGAMAAEASWIVDTVLPELELEVRPRKNLYFIGDDPPLVRARVLDVHFVPGNTSLTVTRQIEGVGTPLVETVRSNADFQNNQWVELPLALGEASQTITVMLVSADVLQNRSEATQVLEVRVRPRWVVDGLSGEAPYYARTPRDVLWTSRGEGAGTGTLSLYLRPVTVTESGWRPMEMGMILLASRVPDSGRYTLPNGLPDVSGDYVITLEPHDTAEPVGFIDGDRLFRLIQPKPAARLEPMPEAQVLEGGIAVYAGDAPAPLTMSLKHLGSDNPYEIPMRVTEFRWRRMTAEGITTPWSTLDVTAVTTFTPTTGLYRTAFAPLEGEGRYQVIPVVTDMYGFQTGIGEDMLTVVFDTGVPVVTVESPAGTKSVYTDEDVARLVFTAKDPLLDAESIGLEYRTFGSEEWHPLSASRVFDTQTPAHATGAFAPAFPAPGRYLVRIRAGDLVNQTGFGYLSSPVYAGSGNYIAVRPIKSTGATENNREDDYTTPLVSRRADFRIQVEPIRPWEEGLKNLTLWWRWRESDDDTHPSSWKAIEFSDRNLIGQQPLEPDGDLARSYFNSLPFTAPRSGRYEFIVTSESNWGQREEPRTPGPASVPEMWCHVYAEPYVLAAGPLRTTDAMTPETAAGLAAGRVVPGSDYLLEWSITTCVNEPLEPTSFTLEVTTNGGEAWTEPAGLKAAVSAAPGILPMPGIGEYVMTQSTVEVDGKQRVRRTWQSLWNAPATLADSSGTMNLMFRITSNEHPETMIPPINRTSVSRAYAVGLARQPEVAKAPGYYERLIAEGDKCMEAGKYAEALNFFRQARAQNATEESNRKITDAEEKLKLADQPVPPAAVPVSDPAPSLPAPAVE